MEELKSLNEQIATTEKEILQTEELMRLKQLEIERETESHHREAKSLRTEILSTFELYQKDAAVHNATLMEKDRKIDKLKDKASLLEMEIEAGKTQMIGLKKELELEKGRTSQAAGFLTGFADMMKSVQQNPRNTNKFILIKMKGDQYAVVKVPATPWQGGQRNLLPQSSSAPGTVPVPSGSGTTKAKAGTGGQPQMLKLTAIPPKAKRFIPSTSTFLGGPTALVRENKLVEVPNATVPISDPGIFAGDNPGQVAVFPVPVYESESEVGPSQNSPLVEHGIRTLRRCLCGKILKTRGGLKFHITYYTKKLTKD